MQPERRHTSTDMATVLGEEEATLLVAAYRQDHRLESRARYPRR